MYFLLNQVTFLIAYWLLENINAIRCPTDRLTWEERAENFTCVDNSLVYHCILDDTYRLVETCADRIPVPVGKPGCPVVRFRDGIAYHLVDKTECPLTNPYCPSGKSAYYSDQLYLYPACFLNESDRSSYSRSTPDTSFAYEYSTKKTTCGNENVVVNNNYTGVIVALVLSVSVSVAVYVVIYIYYKRKKSIKDKRIQQEQVGFGEHTEENGYPVHEEE